MSILAVVATVVQSSSRQVVVHDVLGFEDPAVDIDFTAIRVLKAPGRYRLVFLAVPGRHSAAVAARARSTQQEAIKAQQPELGCRLPAAERDRSIWDVDLRR